ncbi:MAG: hypothetical protein JKY60_12000, partial [Kordiimonadaceae bacterium]|nr:hypothetical protein [Kordiimonadaceae bacterium]
NTFGVDFRSTEFTADASGARLSGGIITPPPGSFLSPFAGSQFIAQSFSEIGRVNTAIRETRYVRAGKASVFTTGTEQLFIRNNRIAPIGTEANQANAQGTETETLNTGFTMAVRGRAANDGTIFLNVRISIRDLIRFETLNASGVRSPIVDENEIDEDLHLAPGEIVILKSFTRTANRIAERRGGNVVCSFWCFDHVAENEVQEFYVVVKATLLAKPRAFRTGR